MNLKIITVLVLNACLTVECCLSVIYSLMTLQGCRIKTVVDASIDMTSAHHYGLLVLKQRNS